MQTLCHFQEPKDEEEANAWQHLTFHFHIAAIYFRLPRSQKIVPYTIFRSHLRLLQILNKLPY